MNKEYRNFKLYKGFNSLEEAKDYLCNVLWFSSIEGFSFIQVSDQNNSYIYPVAMENLELQIIISKEKCWYRNRISDFPYYRCHYHKNEEIKKRKIPEIIRLFGKDGNYENYIQLCDDIFIGKLIDSTSPEMNEFELIGETFEAIRPRISQKWDDLYKRKLEERYNVECIYIGNLIKPSSYVVFDSIILLSTLFFGIIGSYDTYKQNQY